MSNKKKSLHLVPTLDRQERLFKLVNFLRKAEGLELFTGFLHLEYQLKEKIDAKRCEELIIRMEKRVLEVSPDQITKI